MRELQPPPDDAPEWAHEAWVMIENDIGVTAAALAVGKHPKSLRYWIVVGETQRQLDNARKWRGENPERRNELSRDSARKRRQEKPDEVNAYKRRYSRRPNRRGVCPTCGGPKGIDNAKGKECKACVLRRAEEGYQLIVRMWKDGCSMMEIAEARGCTLNALGSTMAKLREHGYDLPHRYNLKRAS